MPQGAITAYLMQLIAKQVDDRGIVVWYDPEHAYGTAAAELTLPHTTIACYDGSFLQLRKAVDPLLNDSQPPRLVVYVPLDREQTHSALIELDYAGVVMQPRQQPPTCNTRLSVVARNALKPILAEDQVLEIERQVEAGKLSLADLNALAEQGIDISTGVVKLIFGTANPQEVALAFLHSDQYDAEVGKKAAHKELRHLLQASFDIELPAAEALSPRRVKLGRQVLLTDLWVALKAQVPSALASVSVAHSAGGIDACVRLTRTWRNSRDVRDSYVTLAHQVEQELALGALALPVEPLKENETFLCVERTLLAQVENELLQAATPALLQLAAYRLSRFWADVRPAIQARWALISSAAEVLLEADRVDQALKKAPTTVPALVKAYADDEEPWCLLDTHHRHLESRKYHFEFVAGNDHQGLEKLITKAEQRYTAVGSELARHFITHFQKAKQPLHGVLRQREVFEKKVKPLLSEGKVAYVWVDALRFEMARELARLLTDDFTVDLEPAIGTIPTITEMGMAALLPKAHESARVVSVGGGKLALEINGKIIKDRKDRVAFLKEQAGGRDMIAADPLAPGSLYTASVDDQGKVGLYRLEVGCSPGTGKLKIAGGIEGAMKESLQRAFAYLQGQKAKMGIGQAFATTDFHVEAIDLLSNHVPCEAGVALVVAIYSAIKRQSVLAGLVILGDLSIQGNLKAVRSLVEPLQVSMDNGARRALVPLENKRNFLEVSGDIVERVDPVFFSDPMMASMKALGLN